MLSITNITNLVNTVLFYFVLFFQIYVFLHLLIYFTRPRVQLEKKKKLVNWFVWLVMISCNIQIQYVFFFKSQYLIDTFINKIYRGNYNILSVEK